MDDGEGQVLTKHKLFSYLLIVFTGFVLITLADFAAVLTVRAVAYLGANLHAVCDWRRVIVSIDTATRN
jgi:hypothetical protein